MNQIQTFEKFLDREIDIFSDGHSIRTPFSLTKKICNELPLDVLIAPKILVLFNVEFVIELVYNKKVTLGHITFCSDSKNKTVLVRKIGVNNIVSENTLNESKKFDVIVGNPPFQSSVKGDASLWPIFVRQSFNLCNDDGFIALVLPSVYGLPGPNIRKGKINVWTDFINKMKILKLNIGQASQHFKNVGLSKEYFGYILCQKSNEKMKTEIETFEENWKMAIDDFNFLPLRGNKDDFSICRKFQILTEKIGGCPIRRGGNYGKNGLGNNVMVFKKARYQPYENCVDFDFTGKRDFRKEITDFGWMPLDESATDKSVKSIFLSKAFRYYAKLIFSGDTFNQGFHQSIPNVNMTTVLTDKKIYSLLDLTDNEIARIESNL